ncbi:MAG: hypothetical protein EBX52_06010 [Proteobacteria bacterium]|nr:hypothetical protein [Pseudomonadota bacterium]
MIRFEMLLAVLIPAWSFAGVSVEEKVLVRDQGWQPVIRSEVLPDLETDQAFEGRYFKIVKGRSESAIAIRDSDPGIRLKAATVYYHLNRVRRFWVESLGSKFVEGMGKTTVRIEITNGFSDLAHFTNDRVDPEYNNAVTVPAGTPMAGVDGVPWGNEIWFRPMKRIRLKDLPESGLKGHGDWIARYIDGSIDTIREGVLSEFIRATVQKLFYPSMLTVPYPSVIFGSLGTLALTALIARSPATLDRLFMKKEYYLDTAMIPEIVTHEFAHLALSDHLDLSRSTPVSEGLADYFSASSTGNPDLAAGIKRYSNSVPKRGRNHEPYSSDYERLYFSNADFVLSVLWSVRELFPAIADRLILHASQGLSTRQSDIRHDLVRALLDACSKDCPDPRGDSFRLIRMLEKKGF